MNIEGTEPAIDKLLDVISISNMRSDIKIGIRGIIAEIDSEPGFPFSIYLGYHAYTTNMTYY
jgi:hypothetical protein